MRVPDTVSHTAAAAVQFPAATMIYGRNDDVMMWWISLVTMTTLSLMVLLRRSCDARVAVELGPIVVRRHRDGRQLLVVVGDGRETSRGRSQVVQGRRSLCGGQCHSPVTSTALTTMDPDGKRARDEHDGECQTERRNQQQRLNAGHCVPAATVDRSTAAPWTRHHPWLKRRRRRHGAGLGRLRRLLPTVGCDERQKVGFTQQADVAGRTAALEATRSVDARAAMTTRRRPTLVHVLHVYRSTLIGLIM